MGHGKWFEGVILHELSHGYHINFLGLDYKPIQLAYKYARSHLYKKYEDRVCEYECNKEAKAYKKANRELHYCLRKDCGITPYAMTNILEYFATITTSAYKVGDNGIGVLQTLDPRGNKMVHEAFSPPDSVFDNPAIDPRFGV